MILFAVAGLIDIKTLVRYWHVSPWDCATMTVTLMMTLVLGVANGVLASIGFSILVFIHYAHQPSISRLGRYFGSTEYAPSSSTEVSSSKTTDNRVVFISKALVVRFEAPLFFANCRTLSRRLVQELEKRIDDGEEEEDSKNKDQDKDQDKDQNTDQDKDQDKDQDTDQDITRVHKRRKKKARAARWKGCVIDFGSVGWIDITASDVLKIPIQLYGKKGYPVYLARCNQVRIVEPPYILFDHILLRATF